MKGEGTEPLDPYLWFDAIDRLFQQQRAGAQLENQLRFSYYLAKLAPPSAATVVHCTMTEKCFEALLEEGHLDLASRALLGALSFEVVRRSDSQEMAARVWLEGSSGQGDAAGEDVASAIFAAWLAFLVGLDRGSSNGDTFPSVQTPA